LEGTKHGNRELERERGMGVRKTTKVPIRNNLIKTASADAVA
jgi:hypothetical protein